MTGETSRLRASGVAFPRSRARRRGLGTSHILILLLVFLVSVAAGYSGYQQYASPQVSVAQPTTTQVRRGTIAATINLMGSTSAVSQAKLTFASTGRLTQLIVKAGDSVKAGDVLAKLDTADLELQVSQAQVSLDQAKLKLDQLKAGPTPADVAAAQAAVRDAEVALANAQDNLVVVNSSPTVAQNVRDRQNEYNWYEANYGAVLKKFNEHQASQSDLDAAYAGYLTGKEKLDTAKLQAQVAVRTAENDVQKAQTNLDKAKTQFDTLTAGASPTDIATQEVAVSQADATLKQKQLLLQQATLLAPFDGIVDSIGVNVGEQVSASSAVMTIVNMQTFRIDARVSETDESRLAVGQTASVTVDALPGERLTAKVASIAANPVSTQGVVNYPVTLDLDPTKAAVRPGMTANVVVEVARRDSVLLVPNRAVRTQGRNRTVEVLVDGKTETRTVNVGMSNDQSTEVLDGLQEGDVVVLPATTTAAPRVSQGGGVGGIPGLGGIPGGFGR